MNLRSKNTGVSAAGLSVLILTGCGGGSGSSDITDQMSVAPDQTLTDLAPDPSSDSTVDSTTDTTSDTTTDILSDPTTTAVGGTTTGPYSGPRLYQTGDTAVQQTVDLAFGSTGAPQVFFTTDTVANVTGDGIPGSALPDFVYDDQGRGIEIRTSTNGAPYLASYNDDDSHADITRTLVDGDIETITFNYEDGRLINKVKTDLDSDGSLDIDEEIIYTYSDVGNLVSAEKSTFFGILTIVE